MFSKLFSSIRNMFKHQWLYRIRYASAKNRWVIELNEGQHGGQHWQTVCQYNTSADEHVAVTFETYTDAAREALRLGLHIAYTEVRYTQTRAPSLNELATEVGNPARPAEVRGLRVGGA